MSPWAFLKRGFLKLVFAEPRKGAVEGRDEQSLGSLRSHLRHRLAFISVSEGHVTCHYPRSKGNGILSRRRLLSL